MSLHGSHVARLPIEMLSAIFQAGPIYAEHRMMFALNVSQVSYLWRQTAMSTPFLWSSLLVLSECGEGWRELMKLMVKLSRSLPLDITVELYLHQAGPGFYDILGRQLNIIIPEISRWKRISYSGRSCEDVFTFFEPLSLLSAPLLEVLDVQAGLDEEHYIDETLCVFAGGAPMLSQVDVDGIKISSCLPPIVPLTSLQLFDPPGPIDFALLQAILAASMALTHLGLDADVVKEEQLYEFAAGGQFFNLHSLRSLCLSAYIFPNNQFFTLFSILRCPGLETMTIASSTEVDGSLDTRPRHSCELPSFTSLQSLELRGVDCTHLCADFDVTKLPALTHITFYRSPTAMALLGALVPSSEGSADVWPLLQMISLDVGSLHNDDVDGLCTVLSYRNGCGKPIKCIKFDTVGVNLVAHDNYVAALRKYVHVETHCVSPGAHLVAVIVNRYTVV